MSDIADLTSAEAGFLYAAGSCEGLEAAKKMADDVAARPLTAAFDALDEIEWEEAREALSEARFEQWWKRGAAGACEDRRQIMEWAKRAVEDRGDTKEAEAVVARRRLERVLRQLGGDLSPRGAGTVDIRSWTSWGKRDEVGVRLVVVGGVLAGALKQASIRRRVASLLHQLPPMVHERVRRGLERVLPLEEAVERRVYEVYRRIAERGHRADEELAVIGLFFVVNACVFRQNAALNRLEYRLPERLREPCREFRRACIKSQKPELSVAVAQTLRVIDGG